MAASTPATPGQIANLPEKGFSRVAAKRRRLAAFVRLNVMVTWALAVLFIASLIYQSVNLIFLRFATQHDTVPTPMSIGAKASELLVYVGLAVCALFLVYLFQRRNSRRRLVGLAPATPTLETKVTSILQPIIALSGLKGPLHLYLRIGSSTESAHSLRIKGENYLVMTPEMAIAVYHQDPIATAVVTHEIAHFLQRDCDLFATAFRFLELYVGYSVAGNLLLLGFAPGFQGYAVARYMGALFAIAFTVLFLFANRRLRRVSERSADLFAVLCGKSVGLVNALSRGPKKQTKAFLSRLFSFHPQRDERLKWIAKTQGLIGDGLDYHDPKRSAHWQFPDASDYVMTILFLLARGLALSLAFVIGLVGLMMLGIYSDEFLR